MMQLAMVAGWYCTGDFKSSGLTLADFIEKRFFDLTARHDRGLGQARIWPQSPELRIGRCA